MEVARMNLFKSLLITAAATMLSVCVGAKQPPPRVILFQLGDDYGFNNVGFPHGPLNAGNPEMRTPTMDRLAMEGIRLERHYVYKYCSPTRSAFLSGRLPIHVNQNNDCNDARSSSGIDLRMTLLPEKLKQAGYTTAIVGKWHCGARSASNLPVNRGFDFHLGFLKGGEDHFRQNHCAGGPNAKVVDLWSQHAPARSLNGTYSAFLYSGAVLQLVKNFTRVLTTNSSAKLFMYLPWHNTHTPLEAPDRFMYPAYYNNSFGTRMQYNAMARALDDGMGNITAALTAAGLWDETLVLFSPDNGGWLLDYGAAGSSNYPLRGGKVTDFEGGVRVASFLSGGYLPGSVRGSRHFGYISIADWYATLCGLAGVDASDNASGVPSTDSLDVWSSLMLPNTNSSPRTSIPLSWNAPPSTDRALIVGRYKIICGDQNHMGYWQGPVFPNSSVKLSNPGCEPNCCMFDIHDDEMETKDLRLVMPSQFALMQKELEEMGKSYFQTNYSDPQAVHCITDEQAEQLYDGFIGPVCFNEPPFPPSPPPPPPRRLSLSRAGPTDGAEQCLFRNKTQIVALPCTGNSVDAVWLAEVQPGLGQAWLAYGDNRSGLPDFIKVDEHPTTNTTSRSDFCRRGRVSLNPDIGKDKTYQGFTFDSDIGALTSTLCTSDMYRCLVVPSDGTAAHGGACASPDARGWREIFV